MLPNKINALSESMSEVQNFVLTILESFASTGKKAATASAENNAPLERILPLRKCRRYINEPKKVAPKYVKTMSAKEYTCVFRTGANARDHTTSIAMAINPVENKITLFDCASEIFAVASGSTSARASIKIFALRCSQARQPLINAIVKFPAAATQSVR